jgi:hypothetical protein
MVISFTCHACGNDISMDEEWAGQRVKCPNCRETVPVPGGSNESTVPESGAPRSTGAGSTQPESQSAGSYAAVPGQAGDAEKTNNNYAKAGFIVAIVSMPLYWVGIIPLIAIVLSCVGLGTFDEAKHNNKWMAGWGLGIGIVFMLMNVAFWRGGFE